MGGIIAHRAITRQRSAHSERFAVATPNDPRYGLAPGERLPVRLAVRTDCRAGTGCINDSGDLQFRPLRLG